MANNPSATKSLVKSLVKTIKDRMESLQGVYDDFPASNQKLKYPSCSVFTQSPRYNSFAPYIVKVFPKITDEEDPDFGKAPVLYCIGRYEFTLQLDFWCESKPQRHEIHEEFVQAFSDLNPTAGINLKIEEYYGEWIHADFGETSFDNDSEISSQRGEWRFKVEVTTNMRCIKRKMENLMETIEHTVETTEGGNIEGGSSGTGYLNETI